MSIISDAVSLNEQKLEALLEVNASELAARFYQPLAQQMELFQINTPLRQAHFLAQLLHESGGLQYTEENLNYSTSALLSMFGKHFMDDEVAAQYARKPEQIANLVYANQMGNGDAESGDGWKYRGRGLIPLSGRDNYQTFSEASGVDVIAEPDQVADHVPLAIATASWLWDSHDLNDLADQDDIKAITKRITGSDKGIEHRTQLLERVKSVLNE